MSMLPFDDRDGVIWFNGELVPWREAKLHVLSHGLHYASSVFEGERSYGGAIFEMRAHHERLHNSANILGFEIPYSVDQIDAAALAVMKANGIVDGYFRPVAWRGSEMMGVSAQETRINLAIAAWDWPSYFSPEARLKGIRLATSPWRRTAATIEVPMSSAIPSSPIVPSVRTTGSAVGIIASRAWLAERRNTPTRITTTTAAVAKLES